MLCQFYLYDPRNYLKLLRPVPAEFIEFQKCYFSYILYIYVRVLVRVSLCLCVWFVCCVLVVRGGYCIHVWMSALAIAWIAFKPMLKMLKHNSNKNWKPSMNDNENCLACMHAYNLRMVVVARSYILRLFLAFRSRNFIFYTGEAAVASIALGKIPSRLSISILCKHFVCLANVECMCVCVSSLNVQRFRFFHTSLTCTCTHMYISNRN